MSPSERMLAELRDEFPRFRVVHKRDSLLSRAIDLLLRVLTIGAQRAYLTHYHTVLGDTLYLPDAWATETETARVIILRHERVHLRQRRRLGFLLFATLYLLPFFPLGLAYGRARLEWEAYRETLVATADLCGLDAARSSALRQHIIGRFCSGEYGWMWPFRKRVQRWYDHAILEIEAAHGHEFG